jgi:hypothetical protein
VTVLNQDPPPYTYLARRAKGDYWYFNCNGLQTKMNAELGTEEFDERYKELLRLAQWEGKPYKQQPRRSDSENEWKVYFLGWEGGPIKIAEWSAVSPYYGGGFRWVRLGDYALAAFGPNPVSRFRRSARLPLSQGGSRDGFRTNPNGA